MRIWLLALSLSIVGCAAIEAPEVSTTFRDYEVAERSTPAGPLDLPQFEISGVTEVAGEEVVYLSEQQFSKMERFVEAAKGNTEALRHRNAAFVALDQENRLLVVAGQATEAQAEVFRSMYVRQARYCSFVQYVSIAGAGLVLVATAL